MKESRQGIQSFVIVIVSLVLAVGSIITAIAEAQRSGTLGPSPSPQPTLTQIHTLSSLPTSMPQYPPTATSEFSQPEPAYTSPTPTMLMPTWTPFTMSPNCTPPKNWTPLVVQYGKSLEEIAQSYQIPIEQLKTANCIQVDDLPPGSIIFVPDTPHATTSTQANLPCSPPPSWKTHTVIIGDTLFSLGKSYGVTVQQLQWANCMGSSTTIRVGSKLWVPNVITNTPKPSITPTIKP